MLMQGYIASLIIKVELYYNDKGSNIIKNKHTRYVGECQVDLK